MIANYVKLQLRRRLVFSAAVCLLQACTAQELYDSAQGLRQNECAKRVDDAERARCFDAANQDYPRYARDQRDKPKD